ncbi:magnesium chelatase [Sphaerisporangium krabiense]|uniref:Magnesium chelatase subunit I n=1 Tax=Sphaerisporangium krabiense TaxID=763782 RepID=A0A7W8Z6D7_9ACTN|nr:AAA family ATPase [Sphaerisporangium krabiense]MBB5628174.1 magnesium chelatase subunit I [Sphaerisporangium krabiense]GII62344.1 magnesium chelatase [Sphaerisporangium krabiense]
MGEGAASAGEPATAGGSDPGREEGAAEAFPILPYSYVVGQDALCRALEIAYVVPAVGGVLVSGERGTAKSTTVRAFARMMYGELPVTLPMNVTDDRVIGGWRIDALMAGRTEPQPGLLEHAGRQGMLYIDEVNLLDDHIVNLILDVVSTGLLVVQREGLDRPEIPLSFTLVGTMNPEEGTLRPQLLDRFGLLVPVAAEPDPIVRREILRTVLRFDEERARPSSDWLDQGAALDRERRATIAAAREAVHDIRLDDDTVSLCAHVAAEFHVAGHRGEIVMAHAARAVAALQGRTTLVPGDVRAVAPQALIHRRREAAYGDGLDWTDKDQDRLDKVIDEA